jgi:hypothetical protein
MHFTSASAACAVVTEAVVKTNPAAVAKAAPINVLLRMNSLLKAESFTIMFLDLF